jgi:hypothetical protein
MGGKLSENSKDHRSHVTDLVKRTSIREEGMTSQQASRYRQQIADHLQEIGRLMQSAQERSEMLAGSFYERRRRCGKRGCRCAQGRLHRDMALAVRRNGSRRLLSLAELEMDRVTALTGNYRRFRQARAEMVRVFGGLLKRFDELGRLRQIEVRHLARVPPFT